MSFTICHEAYRREYIAGFASDQAPHVPWRSRVSALRFPCFPPRPHTHRHIFTWVILAYGFPACGSQTNKCIARWSEHSRSKSSGTRNTPDESAGGDHGLGFRPRSERKHQSCVKGQASGPAPGTTRKHMLAALGLVILKGLVNLAKSTAVGTRGTCIIVRKSPSL